MNSQIMLLRNGLVASHQVLQMVTHASAIDSAIILGRKPILNLKRRDVETLLTHVNNKCIIEV